MPSWRVAFHGVQVQQKLPGLLLAAAEPPDEAHDLERPHEEARMAPLSGHRATIERVDVGPAPADDALRVARLRHDDRVNLPAFASAGPADGAG